MHDSAHEIRHQVAPEQRGRVVPDVDVRAVCGAIRPRVAISRRALHELLGEWIAVRFGATVTALDAVWSQVVGTYRGLT